jgi:hypothetical protein
MKKQTVIGLPAKILGIALLLPSLLSPGLAFAQPISGTGAASIKMLVSMAVITRPLFPSPT